MVDSEFVDGFNDRSKQKTHTLRHALTMYLEKFVSEEKNAKFGLKNERMYAAFGPKMESVSPVIAYNFRFHT